MRIQKPIFLLLIFSGSYLMCQAQKDATIREYAKAFPTYPFSDPNPVPLTEKIYPYFRYDGFTDKPIQKEWKVIELENDYIKLMILPEVGGKIWSAIEKATGKSFIYYNHTVKFRDIAMRGPWTSGGIEPNYGIIGHTPNCATPVDYITMKKADGSVSCVIGVLDLLTRTQWRLEINLPKDKAYLTTRSFWYNATPLQQAYYTWMNTGIKASGNLEFIFPGTHYIGHEGEYSDWPVNKENGKKISFYEQNDFGGPKSYHVVGKYTDFFGAYWHDDDFGMGRFSMHDDKAGKKIWIWGLSEQGMIWEKLLTDTDGQYVEVQSGRFFNQADVGSTFTPFKHAAFFPYAADSWMEYWFPVKQTKGLVKANQLGALNIRQEEGWLKIYFSPLQNIHEELKVMAGDRVAYTRLVNLRAMQVFRDSIRLNASDSTLFITLGGNKFTYTGNQKEDVLSRPLETVENFDWNAVYGLYVQGRENLDQRFYQKAKEKLNACLEKDPNFIPALNSMALLMLHQLQYEEAYLFSKKALRIDTYDPAANYYYALASVQLGNITDAKDGFDIAAISASYRSAAFTELSKLYFRERDYAKALHYAEKSLELNQHNIDALQLMAVIYRLQKDKIKHRQEIELLLSIDPLNHFAGFENYLLDHSDVRKKDFISLIKNELPHETFLELACWYSTLQRFEDAIEVLSLAPQTAEILYWLAWLNRNTNEAQSFLKKAALASPFLCFPFRAESAPMLEWAVKQDTGWKPKYYLGLLYWHKNHLNQAMDLFRQCGTSPDFAAFYAGRANLTGNQQEQQKIADLKYAIELDKDEWRYHKLLAEYFISKASYEDALTIAREYYKGHQDDYIMGMLYAKALLLNKKYKESDALLSALNIIPFEGATEGRELYREAKLMQAIAGIKDKNYKKALSFINASRLWPVNLGVGKPYEEDIDFRVEEWLSYLVYQQTGKTALANASLDKILKTPANNPNAAVLTTARAMERRGNRNEAIRVLDQLIEKYPGNKVLLWSKASFLGKPTDFIRDDEMNATMRILEGLKKITN